jgi:hypothetical protein
MASPIQRFHPVSTFLAVVPGPRTGYTLVSEQQHPLEFQRRLFWNILLCTQGTPRKVFSVARALRMAVSGSSLVSQQRAASASHSPIVTPSRPSTLASVLGVRPSAPKREESVQIDGLRFVFARDWRPRAAIYPMKCIGVNAYICVHTSMCAFSNALSSSGSLPSKTGSR